MNPGAAINDLLPFQGSPFGHLGTSPSCLPIDKLFDCAAHIRRTIQKRMNRKRKGRDSNPRTLTSHWISRPAPSTARTPFLICSARKQAQVLLYEARRFLSSGEFRVRKIFKCGQQDSNLHGLPPDPKSGASANSAMPAESAAFSFMSAAL